MIPRILSSFLAIYATCSVAAETPLPTAEPEAVGISPERLARINEWAERIRSADKFAGAVTVVTRRGKLAHFEAHGYADIEAKRPMEKDTIFALASMTKPIAAVGALMLVEEGRLLLDDPIEKYIPASKDPKLAVRRKSGSGKFDLVPARRSITVQDLLTHRAGFPGMPREEGPLEELWSEKLDTLDPDSDLEEFTELIASLPLKDHPGLLWRYGHSTTVLGRLIEVVSGQTLDVYLKERIFDPLGMVDTAFGVPAEKRSRMASIYLKEEGKPLEKLPERDTAPKLLSAGGGLFSTAPDYMRFAQMLANGGELEGIRILGPKTIELMATPLVEDIPLPFLSGQGYGLTVAVLQPSGVSGLLGSPGTYGWSGAFNTYFRIDPKEDLVLAIFMQLRPGNNLDVTYGFQNLVMSSLVD